MWTGGTPKWTGGPPVLLTDFSRPGSGGHSAAPLYGRDAAASGEAGSVNPSTRVVSGLYG